MYISVMVFVRPWINRAASGEVQEVLFGFQYAEMGWHCCFRLALFLYLWGRR
jgi:hypothetical protein